ncbi:MAG: hypothetical protein AAB657_00550 [Patescibacteria group bacterium]
MIELTPQHWFIQGFNFVQVLLITYSLTFLKIMIEIRLVRVGFDFTEWLWKMFVKMVGLFSSPRAQKLTLFYESGNSQRDKLIQRLKKLGNVGLFALGATPFVPSIGFFGATLYNLERIHQPIYKINNISFICLFGGWLIKMSVAVYLAR